MLDLPILPDALSSILGRSTDECKKHPSSIYRKPVLGDVNDNSESSVWEGKAHKKTKQTNNLFKVCR